VAQPRRPNGALLYFLFFCSGLSGLIYQVAWVREFGNAFGNTVYSASLIVAIFMLGLGVGSYTIGIWADRRYASQPESLLRAYAWAEAIIALLGAAVSLLLPRLSSVSAAVSAYARDPSGWYVLSTRSYLLRGTVAIILLIPITFVMGGTLSLLIRHLVRQDLDIGTRRIALLYAVNTLGAAIGCFATDFVFVPAAGLRATQLFAVVLNGIAAAGAFVLARMARPSSARASRTQPPVGAARRAAQSSQLGARELLAFTSVALALTGFAAIGTEILWLRVFSILLGQFRAVFSSVLTVLLIGMGLGALVGGFVDRQVRRPEHWLMVTQSGVVAATLLGLATVNVDAVHARGLALDAALRGAVPWMRMLGELWFNLQPILAGVALPAFLMGAAFPLANALVQRAEHSVGRRAGTLYLANTVGAVAGSLATGFILLPSLGMQTSASILAVTATLAIAPLYLVARALAPAASVTSLASIASPVVSGLVAGLALALWLQLPSGFILRRAQSFPDGEGRVLAISEGVNEVIAITETPQRGRLLVTNGHPMAGTDPLGQRYMRALAHVPLLSLSRPESVLVIGFGVGNTTHAATLHPTVRRIDVAELSKNVLVHAGYFREFNRDVLTDRRVSVFVNDGRQHLQMQPAASYDLITLEPPPIAHAGVGALYSREFYALARDRLKPGGYISQWLPVYQVSPEATLAMIRAFVEVFPGAALLSGAKADLILLGAKDAPVEIAPERVAEVLAGASDVQSDLQRVALGSVREIVGMFIGASQQLAEATRTTSPVTDDRSIQEYSVRSLMTTRRSAVDDTSASLIDLTQIPTWCPRCFSAGRPVEAIRGIDTYLSLLDQFYTAENADPSSPPSSAFGSRIVEGSAYLGAVLPETAAVHNILGVAKSRRGDLDAAIAEFREALRLDPDFAAAHWQLGRALASRAAPEAVSHLRRAVALAPENAAARGDLAAALLDAGLYDEAIGRFKATLPSGADAAVACNDFGVLLVSKGRLPDAVDQFSEAIRLKPTYVEAYNNLGTALAFQGKRNEAIEQFRKALAIRPDYPDARRNLGTLERGAMPRAFEITDAVNPKGRRPN